MSRERTKRISEEIRRVVSDLVMNELKDPRIPKLTSITHVDTTNDLRFTNIYVSFYEKSANHTEALKGLNSAKGFIRKEIGEKIDLRYTPEPIFKLDNSIENGMHINALLKTVIKEEKDDNNDEDESDLEEDDQE
jgi:ribosome-binding factor A